MQNNAEQKLLSKIKYFVNLIEYSSFREGCLSSGDGGSRHEAKQQSKQEQQQQQQPQKP